MKIGVDARYLSASPSGIGRCSSEMLQAMFRLTKNVEWVVLVHESLPPGWPEEPPSHLSLHRVRHAPVSLHTVTNLRRWVRAQGVKLWWSTFPLASSRLGIPLIVTIHDLQPLLCPGWTGGRPWPLPGLYRKFYKHFYGAAIQSAHRIAADSSWTAGTVRDIWPDAERKMKVVPLALRDDWVSKSVEQALDIPRAGEQVLGASSQDSRTLARSHSRPPAVLYVGSTRPNKNLSRLLEAFALLCQREEVTSDLILKLVVARDRHWPEIEQRIQALGLKKRIQVLENISEEEMTLEYYGASAFAFPTMYEGFGFPPLEAMAHGCPVVAANHGGLPETCGEAAELVDPRSAEDIARGLSRVLNDRAHRDQLRERGFAQARLRTWDNSARMMIEMLSSALDERIEVVHET